MVDGTGPLDSGDSRTDSVNSVTAMREHGVRELTVATVPSSPMEQVNKTVTEDAPTTSLSTRLDAAIFTARPEKTTVEKPKTGFVTNLAAIATAEIGAGEHVVVTVQKAIAIMEMAVHGTDETTVTPIYYLDLNPEKTTAVTNGLTAVAIVMVVMVLGCSTHEAN